MTDNKLQLAKEALNLFIKAAYPVSYKINNRGWNWSEITLDHAYDNAKECLAQLNAPDDAVKSPSEIVDMLLSQVVMPREYAVEIVVELVKGVTSSMKPSTPSDDTGLIMHTAAIEALKCRHGCINPVGVYHIPEGCDCFPDPIQALCSQHLVKLPDTKCLCLIERKLLNAPDDAKECPDCEGIGLIGNEDGESINCPDCMGTGSTPVKQGELSEEK